MKRITFALMLMAAAFSVKAQKSDIVDIAISSKDHTTLVTAVKTAELVGTLKGDGPFTLFAPTNAAFDKLPEGTVKSLLLPENRSKLTEILTYHVISGNFDANAVVKAVKEAKGKLTLTTVQGASLMVMLEGKNVVLQDAAGNKAMVTATDLKGSNGVIHVIDSVLMPE